MGIASTALYVVNTAKAQISEMRTATGRIQVLLLALKAASLHKRIAGIKGTGIVDAGRFTAHDPLGCANDFERSPRGTERTLRRCPQIVGHMLQKFERKMVIGGERVNGIAQCQKRAYGNDVGVNRL